jgi:hypothetical protein
MVAQLCKYITTIASYALNSEFMLCELHLNKDARETVRAREKLNQSPARGSVHLTQTVMA